MEVAVFMALYAAKTSKFNWVFATRLLTVVNYPSMFPNPGKVGSLDVPTLPVTRVLKMVPLFVTAPPVE